MNNSDWLEWQRKVVYEEYIKPYLEEGYDKYGRKKEIEDNEKYAKDAAEK